jgi:hypothetical protein
MPRKSDDELTISIPLSTHLRNGACVSGTLWMHASRRGRFEVEYRGMRKSDGRSDYTNEGHMKAIGVMILREMAEDT